MKEHPILFSGAMVRAILAGTKTQTRRLMRPQPSDYKPSPNVHAPKHSGPYLDAYNHGPFWCWWSPDDRQGPDWIRCPFGVPGDRLWVSETWCNRFIDPPGPNGYYDGYYYAATCEETPAKVDGDGWQVYRKDGTEASPWISPLRMPRTASRITLEVTGVRVERLQEISLDDARAEGIPQMHGEAVTAGLCAERIPSATSPDCRDIWDNSTSVENFARLWDTINGKVGRRWADNPFVWAVSFRRVRP